MRTRTLILGVMIAVLWAPAAHAAAPAAPDRSWGGTGTVTVEGFRAYVTRVQADGHVIAGGARGTGDASVATVARFRADGSLDPTFGTSGTGEVQLAALSSGPSAIAQIELLPDGGVVFNATAGGSLEYGDSGSAVLGRLTSAGAFDPTFSGDGVLHVGIADRWAEATLIVHGASGRIALARRTGSGTSVHVYGADGRTDTNFGTNGRVYVLPMQWDQDPNLFWGSINIHGWGFRPDGSLVGAASTQRSRETCDETRCTHPGSPRRDHLFAFDATGAPVAGFGTDGRVQHDAPRAISPYLNLDDGGPGQVHALADGRIVVVSPGVGAAVEVARFLPDGSRDTSFSSDGRMVVPGTVGGWLDTVSLIPYSAVDDHGRVVVHYADAVARILTNGQLDRNFDPDGAWTVGGWGDLSTGSGGRIYLTGSSIRALAGGENASVVPTLTWTSPTGCGASRKRPCIVGAAPVTGRVSPVPARADRELYALIGTACSSVRRVRIAIADDGTFRVPVGTLLKPRRAWTINMRLAPRGDHTDARSRTLHLRSRLRPICVHRTVLL